VNHWHILGISKTDDKEIIKKAYMAKVAKTNPEEDAEGFQNLRAAYEAALKESDGEPPERNMSPPVAEFMDKLDALYKNFKKRVDIKAWEELFEEDICYHLEFEDELTFFVLDYFSQFGFMPTSAWRLVIKKFDVKNQAEKLGQIFSPNYISYVLNYETFEDGFDFELFGEIEDKDYDRAIFLRNEIRYRLDDRFFDEVDALFDDLDMLNIYHPDFELEMARYLALKKETNKALTMVEKLFEKHKGYNKHSYSRYVYGSILLEFDDEEMLNKSMEIHKALINELPEYYFALINVVEILVKQNKHEEALEFTVEEVLSKYPSSPFVLSTAFNIDKTLMEQNEEKYKNEPENPEVVINLAENYTHVYKYQEAYDLLINLKDESSAKYFKLLAVCSLDLKHYDDAIKYADKSNKLEENFSNYYTKISAFTSMKKYDEALETAEHVFSLDLSTKGYNAIKKARVYGAKSEVHRQLKEYDKAIKALDGANEINGRIAEVYTAKAEIYKEMNNYSEAAFFAEGSLNLLPHYSKPYEILAEIYYNTNNDEQVKSIIERATKFNVISPGLKYYEAIIIDAPNKSYETFKILNEIKDDQYLGKWAEKIYLELYYILANDNKMDEAVAILEEGLKKDPTSENLILQILGVYNDLEKKKQVCEDAINADPGCETGINQLAMIYEDLGQPEKALELLQSKIKEYPKSMNLRLRLGFVLKNAGRHQDAVNELLHVSTYGKGQYLWWSEGSIYFEIALLFSGELNDPKNAMDYVKQALSLIDNDPYIHWVAGNLYSYYFNDYENSLYHYDKSIELDPEDHVNYFHRGMAHKRGGKADVAKHDFEKVLALLKGKNITYHGDYSYISMADIELGKMWAARFAIKNAEKLIKKDGTKDGECWCIYRTWAMYYKAKGKKAKALENINKAIEMGSSVVNNVLKKEIEAM